MARTKKEIAIVPTKPFTPRCRQCKFIELEPKEQLGLCHFEPPKVIVVEDEPVSILPVVDPDTDWCSHYLCFSS
jgi:hypothetical protein